MSEHDASVPAAPATAAPGEEEITVLLDLEGSILDVIAPHGELLGHSPGRLRATSLFRYIHERDLLPVFRGVAELVEGQEEQVEVGFHMRTAGGFWRAVQATMSVCTSGRTVAGMLLTLQILSALS